MSRGWKIFLFAMGFLAATGLEAARADEAYLCEAGRVVYVPFGKLDEMKRTDPCIAGYYGLTVEQKASPAASSATPATAPAATADAPVTAPETAAPPPSTGQRALSSLLAPNATLRLRPVRDADLRPKGPVGPLRLAGPPRAAEGTDYRNIPVLNADGAAPQVYLHQR